MTNQVSILIYADPTTSNPTLRLPDVPWCAGMTVLQSMVLGEAMHFENFNFRVLYRSIYGAQVDSIDGVSDGDKPDHYWLLFVNGQESRVGASEAILLEDFDNQTALVEWRYQDIAAVPHPSAELKTASV